MTVKTVQPSQTFAIRDVSLKSLLIQVCRKIMQVAAIAFELIVSGTLIVASGLFIRSLYIGSTYEIVCPFMFGFLIAHLEQKLKSFSSTVYN